MTIDRRDFLNGLALSVAAGVTPAQQLGAQPKRYPPALTGLRGQNDLSFEAAHALRDGHPFSVDGLPIEESYDLVVVGGGISGLSAAYFYRRANPSARILILDSLDDFGGHARRNEVTIDGRLLIGYGGSQSLQSPRTLFSPVAKGLLRDLGVDFDRFQTAFDQKFYRSLGLSRGVFFNREDFGRDVLVAGDPLGGAGDDSDREQAAARLASFISRFPVSETSKAQLVKLYSGPDDPLPGKSAEEKREILKHTSYRDYLIKICGCSEEVARCFQGRTLGFFALGIDAVAASDVRDLGYPGFAGLRLDSGANPAWKEPYIYHFPDGNASVARLLARALIPELAPGRTMDDVVLARFDYEALDRVGQSVRIRLDSTCVHVANSSHDKVRLAYIRDGRLGRVEARHAVLACFSMMIPYLTPELPPPQRAALLQNVKAPLVYVNVVVRNWRAFERLKVHSIAAPMAFFHQVAMDFPVSLGGYRHPRDPDSPIMLHLAQVPSVPNRGLDARAQYRMGCFALLSTTFADYEARIRDQLDRMLGPGGFASTRDIAAITVNRWAHGYSYVASPLFDPDDYDEKVLKVARQTVGRVAIANTDAGGDAWVHYAIDQAERAVRELVG